MGKRSRGSKPVREKQAFVPRPFEGLRGECDLVAMREIVPSATARWVLADDVAGEHAGRSVTVATLLPLAWPAMVRADGEIVIGLQVRGGSADASRDLADVLLRALEAAPGESIGQEGLPGPGPRLQDLLDPDAAFDVTVRDGFDFWIEGLDDADTPEARETVEKAGAALVPTQRLASVEAAYWCRIGNREHLRWVLPHDEETVMDGLARLHVRGDDALGPDSRYIGAFRAHGLVVPVWDVADGGSAASLDAPVADLGRRLTEAMASGTPLSESERSARRGLVARQVTLR